MTPNRRQHRIILQSRYGLQAERHRVALTESHALFDDQYDDDDNNEKEKEKKKNNDFDGDGIYC